MAVRQLLKTILGSLIGLDNTGALIVNKTNGTQIVIDNSPVTLNPSSGLYEVAGTAQTTLNALVSGAWKTISLFTFGTSISANNWQGPNSATVDLTQNTLSARGYAVAANMLLGNPFTFVRNAGITGNTIAQMRARIATDLLPYLTPGSAVMMDGGPNELPLIVGGASDPTVAGCMADITYMAGLINAAGATVILLTAPPANFYVTGANISARNAFLQGLNAAIIALGAASAGKILVADVYSAVLDTTSAYPAYRSDCTVDNLHPNVNGAMQYGRVIAAVITASKLLTQPINTGLSRSDFKNMVYNPCAAGNNASGTNGTSIGTGMTGNGPDGWTSLRTGTASGVSSVVSRATAGYADAKQGQFARMAVTGGALNDLVGWRWTLGTSGVNWAATTAYPVSRVRMPTTPNGFRAICIVAGTTGGAEPTWPTVVGQTVVDGTVTWAMQDLPVAGDTIAVSLDFGLSGWTGTALVEAQISFTGSAYVINGNLVFAGDAPPTFIPATGTIAMSGTVPAGTTNTILTVYCPASAAATGTFDLSAVSARLTNR